MRQNDEDARSYDNEDSRLPPLRELGLLNLSLPSMQQNLATEEAATARSRSTSPPFGPPMHQAYPIQARAGSDTGGQQRCPTSRQEAMMTPSPTAPWLPSTSSSPPPRSPQQPLGERFYFPRSPMGAQPAGMMIAPPRAPFGAAPSPYAPGFMYGNPIGTMVDAHGFGHMMLPPHMQHSPMSPAHAEEMRRRASAAFAGGGGGGYAERPFAMGDPHGGMAFWGQGPAGAAATATATTSSASGHGAAAAAVAAAASAAAAAVRATEAAGAVQPAFSMRQMGSMQAAGGSDPVLAAASPSPPASPPASAPPRRSTRSERWTAAEHDLFLQGLEQFGRKWRKIQQALLPTKTVTQIRTHAYGWFAKLLRRITSETNPEEVARIMAAVNGKGGRSGGGSSGGNGSGETRKATTAAGGGRAGGRGLKSAASGSKDSFAVMGTEVVAGSGRSSNSAGRTRAAGAARGVYGTRSSGGGGGGEGGISGGGVAAGMFPIPGARTTSNHYDGTSGCAVEGSRGEGGGTSAAGNVDATDNEVSGAAAAAGARKRARSPSLGRGTVTCPIWPGRGGSDDGGDDSGEDDADDAAVGANSGTSSEEGAGSEGDGSGGGGGGEWEA